MRTGHTLHCGAVSRQQQQQKKLRHGEEMKCLIDIWADEHRAHQKIGSFIKLWVNERKETGFWLFLCSLEEQCSRENGRNGLSLYQKIRALLYCKCLRTIKGVFNLRNHDYSHGVPPHSPLCVEGREFSVEETGIHEGTSPACQKMEGQTNETDKKSPVWDELDTIFGTEPVVEPS